ncbi:MAG: glucose-6-phosphate isomerase family protein [Candidatus Daviesbacteria bacterium]|nr:glucose-6-phosphate isomerase family protein [Candidatus Daviesbacteria bacterium]
MLKPFASRSHAEMKDVLLHPEAPGPEIHYYMIRGGKDKTNITVWETGTIGGEYIKTLGHYHVGKLDETYHIAAGEGVVLLQKRKEENGSVLDNEIESFYAIKVNIGDSVFIPSGTGHLVANTGQTWLVTVDDSPVNFAEVDPVSLPGHADYEPVKKLHGFAYYLIEENDQPTLVKNPNYKSVPEPQWLTPAEYSKI